MSYYRCTSTIKKDWDSCKIKQVNASKFESFFIDNLSRISLDRNYIENIFIRLFYSKNLISQDNLSGFELLRLCSDKLQMNLKMLLENLNNKSGIEKNMIIKKFIREINYTPTEIIINIYFEVQNGEEKRKKNFNFNYDFPKENHFYQNSLNCSDPAINQAQQHNPTNYSNNFIEQNNPVKSGLKIQTIGKKKRIKKDVEVNLSSAFPVQNSADLNSYNIIKTEHDISNQNNNKEIDVTAESNQNSKNKIQNFNFDKPEQHNPVNNNHDQKLWFDFSNKYPRQGSNLGPAD